MESSSLVPAAIYSERFTLERMLWPSDLDVFRGVVDVGSLCGGP